MMVHTGDGREQVLAMDVTPLDRPWTRARGVIGREPVRGEAYRLEWDQVKPRGIHMLGVRRPLDVLWLVDDVVQAVETLPAWRGHSSHPASSVVELPAGEAAAVGPGDEVVA